MNMDLCQKKTQQRLPNNGNGNSLYKDIWALILLKLKSPKDFVNVACTCQNAARAASEVKPLKAVEYAEKQYSFMFRSDDTTVISWYLPNSTRYGPQRIYGPQITKGHTTKYYWFGKELQQGVDNDKIEFLDRAFPNCQSL